ncbi:MAG TPA: DUF805 domain-containing protein, partial [Allosphingosinicella sp.]|nr:DUF805 domain-containing protein [Allosphingosinicella sp.]
FAGIFRFSGRDTRAEFWPYAIFLYFAATVVTWLIMMPEMVRMMQTLFQRAAERAAMESEPTPQEIDALVREVMPNFEFLMIGSMVVQLLAILLLAAAVVRRLHDRDRAGYWGLLPLPCTLAAILLAPVSMEGFRGPAAAAPPLLFATFLNGMAYWVLLIILIVMLAREGTSGPNRFGPAPEPH